MKASTLRLPIATGLLSLALCVTAQSNDQKKTCIKLNIVENGKVTNIDTCFVGLSTAEIQEKLKNLNIPDLGDLGKELGDINIVIDSGDGKDGKTEKVEISSDDDKGTRTEVKVISSKNGKTSSVVINGDNDEATSNEAYSYSMADDDNEKEKVMAKTNKNGTCTIIINETDDKDNNSKESKKVKVYVYKKLEIKDLSSEDKKKLPGDITGTSTNSQPFNSLKMAPNPTDGNIRITYKSSSTEPLQIKVYDSSGKTVLSQTESQASDNVDKTISLGNLGKGIYFVHLMQGGQSEVRKIVVN